MKFWKGKWQKCEAPKMVKKQGKDEKILGDSEELTMHRYRLEHKWEQTIELYKENE